MSDDTEEHAEARSVVERYFARAKGLWKMMGGVYWKDKKFMNMVIQAAVLLTNLVIQDEGGLNTWYS